MKKLLFGLALLVTTPALAEKKAPEPEPVTHPDWSVAREQGESQLKSLLFDPQSAVITYTSGFQWGYTKPLLGKRTPGWVACGTINAKNRLGGYVGAKSFYLFVDASGGVDADLMENYGSSCSTAQFVALQPELMDKPAARVAATSVGLADELGKLAELRDKGILSAAEFDAQKAKLLAR